MAVGQNAGGEPEMNMYSMLFPEPIFWHSSGVTSPPVSGVSGISVVSRAWMLEAMLEELFSLFSETEIVSEVDSDSNIGKTNK